MKTWPNWLRLSLEPDEVIGHHEMLRWWLLPRNPWFNAYVHKHQSDDPRWPHDHPCDNLSILLRGRLIEYVPDSLVPEHALCHVVMHEGRSVLFYAENGDPIERARMLGRFTRRRAEDIHRLELVAGQPAWTLWIRWRNRRQWGFWRPSGWQKARSARQA